jgi:hypothetical protein
MNWKRLLSDFLLFAAIQIPFLLTILWRKSIAHFSSDDLVMCALGVIALSLGTVGSQELNRGGHLQAHRMHTVCLGVFFIICGLVFSILLWTKTLTVTVFQVFPLGLIGIYAAKFPLALYLNRKRPESTPQPTSANVS